MRRIAVIGSGTMGNGIAHVAALAGLASGVLPAIWAGRLKVLDAIGYE